MTLTAKIIMVMLAFVNMSTHPVVYQTTCQLLIYWLSTMFMSASCATESTLILLIDSELVEK